VNQSLTDLSRRAVPFLEAALMGMGLGAGLLFWLVANRPWTVERLYAGKAYPPLARCLGFLGGVTPLALGELLLCALLGAGLVFLVVAIARLLRDCGQGLRLLGRGARVVLAVAGLLYAGFVGIWALNYRRPPLAELLGWPVARPGVAELRELCAELAPQVEAARAAAAMDPDPRRVAARAAEGYDRLGTTLAPALPSVRTSPVKPAILSPLMSRSLTYGMVIPWTHEALINRDTPVPAIPFTVCHEMAHQRGIAREDEANFVGYLAARLHPDADFRYSALRFALGEAIAQLAPIDPKASAELVAALSSGVRADYRLESEWTRRNRSAFSRVQARAYDGYLKSQGQAEGLKSYGRVVDLLIAERRLKRAGKLPDPLR